MFTDGVYEGTIITLRDITERKEAEMEMRKVRHKLELLGDITHHDIQNQVTVIMGNVERAKLPNSDPADRLRRIERAATIIGSHIEFARDYQGLGTTAPCWQNVAQTVEGLDIVKWLESLEISGRARALEVSADPMLKKVFHNLLEDSVKYAGKFVCVNIDCEDGRAGPDDLVPGQRAGGAGQGEGEDIREGPRPWDGSGPVPFPGGPVHHRDHDQGDGEAGRGGAVRDADTSGAVPVHREGGTSRLGGRRPSGTWSGGMISALRRYPTEEEGESPRASHFVRINRMGMAVIS